MKLLVIILSLCIASVYCDSEEEDSESLQNIACFRSKLVVEEKPDATYMKIVSDSGELLLNVNSLNTNASEVDFFFVYLTTYLFPEKGIFVDEKSTDFHITHTRKNGGIEVNLEGRFSGDFLRKVIPAQAWIRSGRTTCARIRHFDLIVDPAWDINRSDGYNMTSLLWSCYLGLTDLAKSLVQKGAGVNQAGSLVSSPLTAAILADRDELVELLIRKGARVDGPGDDLTYTPLRVAAYDGRLNAARKLLKHGAPVDAAPNMDRMTPLLTAAERGHLELVDLFLKKGANVNAANSVGRTPLHMAVVVGKTELVDRIIEAGGDVNAKDFEGTPLTLAVSENSNEDVAANLVEHLLKHRNPRVNLRNKLGQTALTIAVQKGFSKVQDLLRAKGARQ